MAGTNAAFNATEFRTAIRLAMVMGQPNKVPEQATFVWIERDVFAAEGPGPETDPYDWTETPTSVAQAPAKMVEVNCAIEYAGTGVVGESMGQFDARSVVLTILDEDWAQVQAVSPHPDQVLLSGVTYQINPPGAVASGLFDCTVYQMRLSALA